MTPLSSTVAHPAGGAEGARAHSVGASLATARNAAALLAVIALPSMGMALGASSMAAGVLAVSALFIGIALVVRHPSLQLGVPVVHVGAAATTLVLILLHGAIAFAVNGEADLERFALTYALLAIVMMGASACAMMARTVSARGMRRGIVVTFVVLVVAAVSSKAGFSPFFSNDYSKSVLFFAEPSHFALDFLPVLVFVLVGSSAPLRIGLLLGAYGLGFALENMTLLIGTTLAAMLTLRVRHILIATPIAAILLATAALDFEYYSSRLGGLDTTGGNSSTLTFLDGWERAFLDVRDSFGVGVGFQQFGIVGGTGEMDDAFAALGLQNQNPLDGSTVGCKLVGEFGLLGLVALGAYVAGWARQVRKLRSALLGQSARCDPSELLFRAWYVCFVIDLFVRGTGYFSSTGFLFISALMASLPLGPVAAEASGGPA